MVARREYAALEAHLTAHRDAARANRFCEGHFFFAYTYVGGKYGEEDLAALDAWVAARPDALDPWAARAEALQHAGNLARGSALSVDTPREKFERMHDLHARALADADRAIAIAPDHPIAYGVKLAVFKARGDRAEVQRVAAAILAHDPASYGIRRRLISALDPKWGGSLDAVEEVVEASQAFADREPRLRILRGFPHAYRGAEANRNGDRREALIHYSRALQFGDYRNEWSVARGRVLSDLGRPDLARADYERALEILPEDTEAGMALATLEFRSGSEARGLSTLAKVLERNPTYAYGFALRGWMYRQQKRWNEAAADYARAIELGSTEPATAEALGYLLYHDLDRPAEAEPILRRAIEINPNHPMLHLILAGALDELGRKDEARAQVGEFLVRAEASDDPRVLQSISEARRFLNEEL